MSMKIALSHLLNTVNVLRANITLQQDQESNFDNSLKTVKEELEKIEAQTGAGASTEVSADAINAYFQTDAGKAVLSAAVTTQIATLNADDADEQGAASDLDSGLSASALALSVTLSDGQVGQAYSYSLSATGGTPPYTYSAQGLPTGLSLDPGGTLSGTPTDAGTFSPFFTVTDSEQPTGVSTQASAGITIAAALGTTEPQPQSQTDIAAAAASAAATATAAAAVVTTSDPVTGQNLDSPVILTTHPETGAVLTTPVLDGGEPAAGTVVVDPVTGTPTVDASKVDGAPAVTLGATTDAHPDTPALTDLVASGTATPVAAAPAGQTITTQTNGEVDTTTTVDDSGLTKTAPAIDPATGQPFVVDPAQTSASTFGQEEAQVAKPE